MYSVPFPRFLGWVFIVLNSVLLTYCIASYFNNRTIFGLDGLALFNGLTFEVSSWISILPITLLTYVLICLTISSIRSYWLGYFLGWALLKFKSKNLLWLFFILLITGATFFIFLLKQNAVSLDTVIREATSAEDCLKYPDNSSFSVDQCIGLLATKLNDVSVCDNLLHHGLYRTEHSVGRCYIDYAHRLSTFEEKVAVCDLIRDNKNKFECYNNFHECNKMIATDDPQYYSRQEAIDSCWGFWAGRTGNNNYCQNVQGPDSRKECGCKAELGETYVLSDSQKNQCGI